MKVSRLTQTLCQSSPFPWSNVKQHFRMYLLNKLVICHTISNYTFCSNTFSDQDKCVEYKCRVKVGAKNIFLEAKASFTGDSESM